VTFVVFDVIIVLLLAYLLHIEYKMLFVFLCLHFLVIPFMAYDTFFTISAVH